MKEEDGSMKDEWITICRLEDILPDTGVCALVGGRQIAVFRVGGDGVNAIDNHDPFSKANVLSRGIVGDLKGELVVASPVYKQHFSLVTGRCIEDEKVSVPVYGASVQGNHVMIQKPAVHNAALNGRN
jgi:NAD(P)H-dependent nitrite reductase small subunit